MVKPAHFIKIIFHTLLREQRCYVCFSRKDFALLFLSVSNSSGGWFDYGNASDLTAVKQFSRQLLLLLHRGWVKPSPIKKKLSAEVNDMSHKSTFNGSPVMKGAWLKHRGQAKPSPMKKEISAEFNDTSHKTLP